MHAECQGFDSPRLHPFYCSRDAGGLVEHRGLISLRCRVRFSGVLPLFLTPPKPTPRTYAQRGVALRTPPCYTVSMSRTRAEHAAYMLKRYHTRREAALLALGGKCVRCGSTEGLELDHIDPTTKTLAVGKLWSVSLSRYEAEIVKCQLLCRACHSVKSVEDSGKASARGQHGTPSSYRYCKCALCRAANTAYMQEYRKRKGSVGV